MSVTHQPSRHRGGTLPAVIAVIAMVMVALGWGVFEVVNKDDVTENDAARADKVEWYTVTRKSFDVTVVAAGELRSKEKHEVKNQLEGIGTIAWIIDEGEKVKKGDTLVKLDDAAVKEKIETENIALEKAKETLINARQGLAIQTSEANSQLDAAQVALDMAELDLKKWEKGDVPKKRTELDQAIRKAERNLERAKENEVTSAQLYKEEFISKQEWEDDKLALIESGEARKIAELDKEVYEKYTLPKEERKYESDVAQAKAKLERTRSQNESNLAKSRGALQSAEETLRIRNERGEKLNEQLAACEIKAPADGLVVYATSVGMRRYSRSEPIGQGSQIRFGETLINLPNTTVMQAAIKVHEALLRHVKEKQDVSVTIDAWPGKPIVGKVESIGVMAESGNWFNPNLREYRVAVDLPRSAGETLKPGMRCSGTIQVGKVTDQLAVPVQAVHTEGRVRFCYVKAENGVIRQVVKAGRASETTVEITEGLEANQQVLLRRPRPGEVLNEDKDEVAKLKEKFAKEAPAPRKAPESSGMRTSGKPGKGMGMKPPGDKKKRPVKKRPELKKEKKGSTTGKKFDG